MDEFPVFAAAAKLGIDCYYYYMEPRDGSMELYESSEIWSVGDRGDRCTVRSKVGTGGSRC